MDNFVYFEEMSPIFNYRCATSYIFHYNYGAAKVKKLLLQVTLATMCFPIGAASHINLAIEAIYFNCD